MSTRPNFILYITDQHRADFLGCYGHPILKTPNIDAIAQHGIAYDRFYVASPVCMPNRASLMTCRMPSSHGVRFNGIPLDHRNVTFVDLLRDAGYDTALIGKSHLQTFTGLDPLQTIPEARPEFYRCKGELSQAVRNDHEAKNYNIESPDFWSRAKATVPTPFYGFDHVDMVTRHGDGIGGDYNRWLHEQRPDASTLIGADNQLPHDYRCPQAVRTAVPEELYSTSYIALRAEQWLASRQNNDRPFFLMVSWPDPHHPFNPPGKYWNMYNPDDFPVPQAFESSHWIPPPNVVEVHKARVNGAANMAGMEAIGCSEREAREAQALTCGMITMIDDAVGRVQTALNNSGHADETVKIFTTDHGEHLGDHRLLFKGAEQYEQITRVPLIWADPHGISNARSNKIGQTLDIGTTILERARVEPAWGMQGCDLAASCRDHAFIQYAHQQPMLGLDLCPYVHTIRDTRFRLSIFHGVDWGELYDLEKDPGELQNLWVDPLHAATKAKLIEELARCAFDSADTFPAPISRA